MHSYRWANDDKIWEVFFDDGAPDSAPRVLRRFNLEWNAMQLVNFLNGGRMTDTVPTWLF